MPGGGTPLPPVGGGGGGHPRVSPLKPKVSNAPALPRNVGSAPLGRSKKNVIAWPGSRKRPNPPEVAERNQLILLFSSVGSCCGLNANSSNVHSPPGFGFCPMFVAP